MGRGTNTLNKDREGPREGRKPEEGMREKRGGGGGGGGGGREGEGAGFSSDHTNWLTNSTVNHL